MISKECYTIHRLSIDIDVICPPGTDITQYLVNCEQFGFTSVKMIEKGVYEYRKFDIGMDGLADMRLANTVPVRLGKLKRNNPEAGIPLNMSFC